MEELKNKLSQLVSRARVENAFEELLNLSADQLGSDAKRDILALQARWVKLKKDERRQIISGDQAGLERNRITYALLDIIGELGQNTPLPEEPEEPEKPKPETPASSLTRILFLAANPTQTGQLRLGAEHREIRDRLRGTTQRDKYELEPRFAARPRDLSEVMSQYAPHIVHFSGHGLLFKEGQAAIAEGDTRLIEFGEKEANIQEKFSGGIVLETSPGKMHVVAAEALGALFKLHAKEVKCVFLNACYSEAQADAIIEHVPFVVGMNTAVPDETAIVFAEAFYFALGEREDIPYAFESAKVRLQLEGLEGADIPVLKRRTNPST